jgi:hypothetical protein
MPFDKLLARAIFFVISALRARFVFAIALLAALRQASDSAVQRLTLALWYSVINQCVLRFDF